MACSQEGYFLNKKLFYVFAIRLMNCLRSVVPAMSCMLVNAKVDFLDRSDDGMVSADSACVVALVMTAYSRVIRGGW